MFAFCFILNVNEHSIRIVSLFTGNIIIFCTAYKTQRSRHPQMKHDTRRYDENTTRKKKQQQQRAASSNFRDSKAGSINIYNTISQTSRGPNELGMNVCLDMCLLRYSHNFMNDIKRSFSYGSHRKTQKNYRKKNIQLVVGWLAGSY